MLPAVCAQRPKADAPLPCLPLPCHILMLRGRGEARYAAVLEGARRARRALQRARPPPGASVTSRRVADVRHRQRVQDCSLGERYIRVLRLQYR